MEIPVSEYKLIRFNGWAQDQIAESMMSGESCNPYTPFLARLHSLFCMSSKGAQPIGKISVASALEP
jgi:hypothetical protein